MKKRHVYHPDRTERELPVDEFINRNLTSPDRFDARRKENHTIDTESVLTDEVRTADLTKYSDAALEGRLAQYLRDYTFENCPSKRAEFKREMERTKIEINRRKMYRTEEALRQFKL